MVLWQHGLGRSVASGARPELEVVREAATVCRRVALQRGREACEANQQETKLGEGSAGLDLAWACWACRLERLDAGPG